MRLDQVVQYVMEVSEREGRNAVIVPDAFFHQARELFSGEQFGFDDEALDAPIAVLTVQQAKGLEFDCVLLLDTAAISAQHERGADVYVAATRATQRLHLIELLER